MSRVLYCISVFLILVCSSFVQSQSESTTTAPPPPEYLRFKVLNDSNICLLGQFYAQVTIPYFSLKESLSRTFYINSSNWIDSGRGVCKENSALTLLNWFNHPDWDLELFFQKTDSGLYGLVNVTLKYHITEQQFPSTNETGTIYTVHNNQSQFSCSLGSYYSCVSKQTILLKTDKTSYPEVSLSFTEFRVEAFRSDPKDDYVGYATTCNADYVPDKAVPIAVGITLAVLIIVALLTFILGSRFRQNGYAQI